MERWIKSYSLAELERKEKVCFRTLKKRASLGEYIPVEFQNGQIKAQARVRKMKGIENPLNYSLKYIRRKDLEKYLEKIRKQNGMN